MNFSINTFFNVIKSLLSRYISLETAILCIVAYLLLKLIIKIIIKPYLLCLYYKKQGAKMFYFPAIGFAKDNIQSYKQHNDCFYYEKQMAMNQPKLKTWCTNLGSNVILHIVDPKLLQKFYSLQTSSNTMYNRDLDFWWIFLETAGLNFGFVEGAEWKRHRKAMSQVFNNDYLRDLIPVIIQKTQTKLQKMAEDSQNKGNVQTFESFTCLIGDILSYMLFGDDFNQGNCFDGQSFASFMTDLNHCLMQNMQTFTSAVLGKNFVKLGLFSEHREMIAKIETFKRCCRKIVDDRRAIMAENPDYNSNDLLTKLIKLGISDPSETLNTEEILGTVSGLSIAGIDTTSQLVGMMVFYLDQNPTLKPNLQKEVDNLFNENIGDDNINISNITQERLNKMDYMTAYIKESLRHSSIANKLMFRVAKEDHMIEDVKVKKGTYVTTSFIFNNYCTRFHEDPMTFNPNRWLDDDSLTKQSLKGNPTMFLPFSYGHRVCLGQQLSYLEAKLIMSVLLKEYSFHIDPKYVLKWNIKFLYGPEEDPILFLTKKSSSKCKE